MHLYAAVNQLPGPQFAQLSSVKQITFVRTYIFVTGSHHEKPKNNAIPYQLKNLISYPPALSL